MILKECFTDEFIKSKAGENLYKKIIYEKVVHAFYLLEKLAREKINFVFKGGTSLMLLLNEFNRFSVDIDILMESGKEKIIEDVVNKYNDEVFVKVEEDVRRPTDIIKKHFKFYYKSIYGNQNNNLPYILLDIVFDDFKYSHLVNKPIESNFIKTTDPLLCVKVPSIDEILGDKLTAFAPKTIGILYYRPSQVNSKHVEIIKQLYDVSKLYDKMTSLKNVRCTYYDLAKVQLKNRNLDLSVEDCLFDSISTCKLIISEGKFGGTIEEYGILKKGYEGFKNYVVSNFSFHELITMAVKAYALCIDILYDESSINEAKPIETFIGRKYKYIRQIVGDELYSALMRRCYIENQHKLLLINNE